MNTRTRLVGIGLLCFSVAACGEDKKSESGSKIDSKKAKVVQTAASDAVTDVVKTKILDSDALEDPSDVADDWLSGSADQFDVAGSMPNDLGGALDVAGSGAKQSLDGAFDFDLDLTFNDWEASGLLLNGTLKIKVAITSYTPVEVDVKVTGTLNVSGEFEGKVPLDLSIDMSGEAESICGEVGGYGDACDGVDPDPEVDPDPDPEVDPDPEIDPDPEVEPDPDPEVDTKIDSQEASLIQSALSLAMAQLQQDLVSGLSMLDSGVPLPGGLLDGDASSFLVDGTISGAMGGLMELSGTGGATSMGYEIDATALLKNWQDAAGVVLDGSLTIRYEISEMMPLDAIVTVTGSVDASGAAQGEGDVDLTFSVSDTDTEICGSVAGYDMSDSSC